MLSVTAPRAKKGVVDKDISTLRLSAEILSVFFIIYHHSGDVRLADGDAPGFEIVLPTNPNKVSLAPPAPYWLNDVLSSFE